MSSEAGAGAQAGGRHGAPAQASARTRDGGPHSEEAPIRPGDRVHDSGGGYPLTPARTWPAADIAAAWRRELPGVPTGSIEVITPLWRIAKMLADERRRTLHRLRIDPSTLDLLSVIRRAGPPYELTTREITRRTLVTAGAVSQRIARAEQAGLVRRAPSRLSRRAVSVRLTDAGHRLIEDSVRHLLGHEASLVSALSPPEQATLARLLATLEQALSPSRGEGMGEHGGHEH